jgi:intracellular sulfur oxidation DsrE/DsrF family protein
MKRFIIISGLVIFTFNFSIAQGKRPYNVVFDITSKDTVEHKAVIRWVNEILKADPNAKLEVVFYGQSLDMVVEGKSLVEESVKKLAENKNVAFRVCAVAMKNHNLDRSQLIAGVETVPDGIYEIISKQGEGWGYIKVAF